MAAGAHRDQRHLQAHRGRAQARTPDLKFSVFSAGDAEAKEFRRGECDRSNRLAVGSNGYRPYTPISARKGKTLRFQGKSAEGYTGGRSTGRVLSGAENEMRSDVEHVTTVRASITTRERESNSPYVESVMHGSTLSDDSPTRPAECHWHMVFVRKAGETRVVFVGPWTTGGVAHYAEGAEIRWIKFELGAFMPHMPAGRFLDTETILPGASGRSFWLKGSAWEFPNHENVETFVEKLVRNGVLVRDPLVDAVLRGQPQGLSPRTVRHRFLRATGLTQSRIRQIERAKQAASLLRQGHPISDAVHEVGYFDQPHLTRSLKQWIGHTPARILRSSYPG
jgi:Helix-turn-helix domain